MSQQNLFNGETYNAIRTKINENFLELFGLIQNLTNGIPLPTPNVTPSSSGPALTPGVTPSTSGPALTPGVTPSSSATPPVTPAVTPSITPTINNPSANPFASKLVGPSAEDPVSDDVNGIQLTTTFADTIYYNNKTPKPDESYNMTISVNGQARANIGFTKSHLGEAFGYSLSTSHDQNPQQVGVFTSGTVELSIYV